MNKMSNVKIYANVIEDEAREQIELLAQQKSFCDQKIRIMPDVHAGKGCVVGFTSTIGDYVVPNVVGVDIGCGMVTIELDKCELDLQKLDDIIREHIPSGKEVHEGRKCKFDKLKTLKCYRELKDTKRIEKSIGTLGGGNHFIEVGQDDEGNKYLIIHTGSRNLGKQVAEHYQNLAYDLLRGMDKLLAEQEKMIADYKAQGRKAELQQAIKELRAKYKANDCDIPKDLAYLSGRYKDDYLHDMAICQEYAVLNRATIANIILEQIGLTNEYPRFETIHNYIDLDSKIIRKGAVNADEGRQLLIPINMRDGCIIGIGKGNADWNNSAPHGAGRKMSRTKAKATFTLEEYQRSMEGVFTTSVGEDTLDELPMAYKDMSDIVDVIDDTVEIKKIIKPIYNYKAGENTKSSRVNISRFLSKILRHKPELISIELDPNGWANVDDLIQAMANDGRNITLDELKSLVSKDNKRRYSFSSDYTKIRANQGHTIDVNVELWEMKPPQYLYHGTAIKNIEAIKRDGLKSMKRLYVHLSNDTETAANVGKRHGSPIVLTIASERMHSDGIKFYLSENGVWLVERVQTNYINFEENK